MGTALALPLRMVASGSIPTSEADYLDYGHMAQIIWPMNGGDLQADGSWLQDAAKAGTAFALGLPVAARAKGQQYLPMVSSNHANLGPVLADAGLQHTAAHNLVTLATIGRFDSPWDGVCLDIEGAHDADMAAFSAFLQTLSSHLRAAGMRVDLCARGRISDAGADYDGCYALDYTVASQIADFIALTVYGYWQPAPRSWGPYWHNEACIQYILSKGVSPSQILLGLPNNVLDGVTYTEYTHDEATALIVGENAALEWIETNVNGIIRERHATAGSMELWVWDGAVIQPRLQMCKDYGLAGVFIWLAGMGDGSEWQAISDWKRLNKDVSGFVDIYGRGGLLGTQAWGSWGGGT